MESSASSLVVQYVVAVLTILGLIAAAVHNRRSGWVKKRRDPYLWSIFPLRDPFRSPKKSRGDRKPKKD
jgi:hypothetical protein